MRGPGIGCWFTDRSNCSHRLENRAYGMHSLIEVSRNITGSCLPFWMTSSGPKRIMIDRRSNSKTVVFADIAVPFNGLAPLCTSESAGKEVVTGQPRLGAAQPVSQPLSVLCKFTALSRHGCEVADDKLLNISWNESRHILMNIDSFWVDYRQWNINQLGYFW